MEDLDLALNELGMLSSATKYKMDYLKAIEASAEMKRARSVSMPDTSIEESVSMRLNSNYVTKISLKTPSVTDLSPYSNQKLEMEIEDRRLNDNNCNTHFW